MALINCPECGREISDKAEKCVHCGCPAEAMLRETGQQPAEVRETETKKNGMRFTKETAIIFIGFMLVIISIFAVFGVSKEPRPNAGDGYFRNTEWGMTREEVVGSEKTRKYSKGEMAIWYKGIFDNYGFEGIETDVGYMFDDDGLLYFAEIETHETGKLSKTEFRQNLVDAYRTLYGDDSGGDSNFYRWETDKSIIGIIFFDDWVSISFIEIDAFNKKKEAW